MHTSESSIELGSLQQPLKLGNETPGMRETLFASPLKIWPNLVVRNYRKAAGPACDRAGAGDRPRPPQRPPTATGHQLRHLSLSRSPASGPGGSGHRLHRCRPARRQTALVGGKGSLPQAHGQRGSSAAPAAASAPPGSVQHSPRTASHQHRHGRTHAAAAAAPASPLCKPRTAGRDRSVERTRAAVAIPGSPRQEAERGISLTTSPHFMSRSSCYGHRI